MKTSLGMVMFLTLSPLLAMAEVVVPVDAVESYVNIRMSADANSDVVGRLQQGESMPFVQTVSGWHEIALKGGGSGFIHEDWSVVAADAVSRDDNPEHTVAEPSANVVEADLAEPDNTEVAVPVADVVVLEEIDVTKSSEIGSFDAEAADKTTASEQSAPQAVADVEDPIAITGVDADIEAVIVAAEEGPAVGESRIEPALEPVTEDSLHSIVPVLVGPSGPGGPTGPPGPPGAATVEGSVDYLMKFTGPTVGGNSQIFDNGRNIGIGTDSPKQRLEVNGNIQIHEQNSNVAGIMLTQSSGETGYIMHNRASTLTIGAGSVDRITIDRDGNVGIGMSRPNHPIELPSGAHVTAGGAWTNSSSIDRKENISELTPEEALRALADLEPVHFNYKQDDTERYVGFIAEDVPDLVATTDRKGLSTMDIVAVLTRVVQIQQQQIEKLEARLSE